MSNSFYIRFVYIENGIQIKSYIFQSLQKFIRESIFHHFNQQCNEKITRAAGLSLRMLVFQIWRSIPITSKRAIKEC